MTSSGRWRVWRCIVTADPYTELAMAILVWDLMTYGGGTRGQQITAERKLHELADQLREAGYEVRWKDATS